MTVHLGLTGGIASGKSTVATMFSRLGCPVFDADACVHWLYREATIVQWFAQYVPDAVQDEQIDRPRLAAYLRNHPDMLPRIEAFVHPLVRLKEQAFIKTNIRNGTEIIISDIPLLFETRKSNRYDATIVVTAPLWLRERRAARRNGLSPDRFAERVAQQMPDADKIKHADIIIRNGLNKAFTFQQVQAIINGILPMDDSYGRQARIML